ncbi:MAG: DUF58 domain-containing protein [Planctomycetota bacterium]
MAANLVSSGLMGPLGSALRSVLRLPMTLRYRMTAASATLVIFMIAAMNVIWQYPWLGVLAACLSLLLVGGLINSWMKPDVSAIAIASGVAVAGEPIDLDFQMDNRRRRRPALDLDVAFDDAPKSRGVAKEAIQRIERLPPGGRIRFRHPRLFQQRGMHPIPSLQVTSYFPFHLFRSICEVPIQGRVAVTPRSLPDDAPEITAGLRNAMAAITGMRAGGVDDDYAGAREYQIGMTVRQWDFRSWARLNRPIIRETVVRSDDDVCLLVDPTLVATDWPMGTHIAALSKAQSESIERLFSLAATLIRRLAVARVKVHLVIMGEAVDDDTAEDPLIRLAAAFPASEQASDAAWQAWMREYRGGRVIAISTRNLDAVLGRMTQNITTVHVRPQMTDLQRPRKPGRFMGKRDAGREAFA